MQLSQNKTWQRGTLLRKTCPKGEQKVFVLSFNPAALATKETAMYLSHIAYFTHVGWDLSALFMLMLALALTPYVLAVLFKRWWH